MIFYSFKFPSSFPPSLSSLFPFSSFCDPEKRLSVQKALCPHLLSFLQLFWMQYFISSTIFLFYSALIFFFLSRTRLTKKNVLPLLCLRGPLVRHSVEVRDEWIKSHFWSCLVSPVWSGWASCNRDLNTVTAAVDSGRILSPEHACALFEYSVGGFVCEGFWECKGYSHTYVYSVKIRFSWK